MNVLNECKCVTCNLNGCNFEGRSQLVYTFQVLPCPFILEIYLNRARSCIPVTSTLSDALSLVKTALQPFRNYVELNDNVPVTSVERFRFGFESR